MRVIRSQDCSAGIVTGLWAGEQRIYCCIPSNSKTFLPFTDCLNRMWGPRNLLIKIIWFLFPGITWPEREGHLPLACFEIKIIESIIKILWFLFPGIMRPEREDHLLLACSEIKIIGSILAPPHTL